jgi:hypothetical protein
MSKTDLFQDNNSVVVLKSRDPHGQIHFGWSSDQPIVGTTFTKNVPFVIEIECREEGFVV